MPEEMWLRFGEAVALVRELRAFNGGKSTATVKRAIVSGEVRCSFSEQYIVNEEKLAHQELDQSMQREAAGRNLIMSGGALDILRSRSQQGAYKRAGLRLRLINDVCSPEFNEQLMLGNIRVSRGDFIDWLDQHLSAAGPNRQQPRQGSMSDRVGGAIRALWGEGGPPLNLPWHLICRDVRDWLKKHEGREPQLTDRTIQNAVKKIRK